MYRLLILKIMGSGVSKHECKLPSLTWYTYLGDKDFDAIVDMGEHKQILTSSDCELWGDLSVGDRVFIKSGSKKLTVRVSAIREYLDLENMEVPTTELARIPKILRDGVNWSEEWVLLVDFVDL